MGITTGDRGLPAQQSSQEGLPANEPSARAERRPCQTRLFRTGGTLAHSWPVSSNGSVPHQCHGHGAPAGA